MDGDAHRMMSGDAYTMMSNDVCVGLEWRCSFILSFRGRTQGATRNPALYAHEATRKDR
jgi:hypothetical protein